MKIISNELAMIKELRVASTQREAMLDITDKVQLVVKESGIREGTCLLYCPHTTAGLVINERADPAVREDMLMALKKMVPQGLDYKHAEGNADAHVKSSLLGSSLMIFIEKGRLKLGIWQAVMFGEFDGPKERKLLIKIMHDDP